MEQNGRKLSIWRGMQRDLLKGVRIFKNYESAEMDHRAKVSEATADRVASGKTLDLGTHHPPLKIHCGSVSQSTQLKIHRGSIFT